MTSSNFSSSNFSGYTNNLQFNELTSRFKFNKRLSSPVSTPTIKSDTTSSKQVRKRKSLLSTLPWLSSKSLEDIDTITEISDHHEIPVQDPLISIESLNNDTAELHIDQSHTNQSDEIQESVIAQSTIFATPSKLVRTPVLSSDVPIFVSPMKPFSLLDDSAHNTTALFDGEQALYPNQTISIRNISQDDIEFHPNSVHMFSSTQPQEVDLNEEIERLLTLNMKLSKDNHLYDVELNKALELNMGLEVTLDELTRKLDEPAIQQKVKKSVEPFNEFKEKNRILLIQLEEYHEREEESMIEKKAFFQDYNTLADSYNQLITINSDSLLKYNQQEEVIRLFQGRFKKLSELNNNLNKENDGLREELRKLMYEAGSSHGQSDTSYWKDLYHLSITDNDALKVLIEELSGSPSIQKQHNFVREDRIYPLESSTRQSMSFEDSRTRSPYESRTSSPNRSLLSSRQKAIEYTSPIRESFIRTMTPVRNQEVHGLEFGKAKQLLESELVRLTKERDMLRSEYQKMPIYGGKLNTRNRSEQIEQSLDERESEIASVKKKMKEMGIM